MIGPSVPPLVGEFAACNVGAISSWILELIGSEVGLGGHTSPPP